MRDLGHLAKNIRDSLRFMVGEFLTVKKEKEKSSYKKKILNGEDRANLLEFLAIHVTTTSCSSHNALFSKGEGCDRLK